MSLVDAEVAERHGRMFLIKNCPECGPTETLISSDAERYRKKRSLDPGFEHKSCTLECVHCKHKNQPNLVFVDITNRCNLNCPICINNTPSMGFLFEPPFEYFEKIFRHLASLEPKPSVQLFGGEPTVRKDLFDIIRCARSYGLPTRLVTNGVRLADEDYCRKVIESRATILIAYDGRNPEAYRLLRGTEKALEQKLTALDNISRIGGAKVTLMTLAAKGFNDHELSDLFQFCHERRDCIRAIYFMPLAHTWDSKQFDLEPERITTEDVEQIVDDAFPDDDVEFLPAGLLGQIRTLLTCLRVKPLPFLGAHPNCESMYVLVSDGETYVPIGRYLKSSIVDVARELREADKRLARRVPAVGKAAGLRKRLLEIRAFLAVTSVLRRHAHVGRLFKGRGLGKLYHALATPLGFLFGLRSRRVLGRHTNVQGVLQLVVLPFEDKTNIETDRLERCPTAFAFYDPEEDKVRHVPTCAWGLHKTTVMRGITDYYAGAAGDQPSGPAEMARSTTDGTG
jgi:uncharacterized radical SAM superfamily Fe-S cluster-containing enzyme